jgi:hypothetical protein
MPSAGSGAPHAEQDKGVCAVTVGHTAYCSAVGDGPRELSAYRVSLEVPLASSAPEPLGSSRTDGLRPCTSAPACSAGPHARIRSVTIPREALTITLVLAAAFGSACDVLGPSACTLIGCTGLTVEVSGAPGLTPVTVVVTAPDGSTRSATCTGATGTCPVSFFDFTPASVTIRVSTGTQTTELTRQPMYEVTRPNGPACPPECRSARVTVAL